ncbi:L,D-transpeptidase family protein [Miltoncostaea oceani]|uniref:L,D-transpeptidase family protein n=1 Tax=Miltoncostaea oceani TaxID=2843216 RepID=UPI001C3E5DD2|nr:L,D-transpeptidase family protein [Miltoncostaea oceani]
MTALGAACLAGMVAPSAADAATPATAPTDSLAWAGRVIAPIDARTAPDPGAKKITRVSPTAPLAGGEAVLSITRSTVGKDGRDWVEVLLPIRPSGRRGWVPADVLSLRKVTTRIEISTGSRTLTLFRSGRRVLTTKVAVGKAGTPTPLGRFAIAELIRLRTPDGALGPVVLPLTAYSPTLNEFAGGDGRVAVHGTSSPGLLGTRASNGCIRVHNNEVLKLARLARPGTPVRIR